MSIARKQGNFDLFNKQIEKLILDAQEKQMEALAKEVEVSMDDDLEKTLKGTFPRGERELFGERGFSDARPEITVELKRTSKGIVLKVHGVILDERDNPHEIWHRLNKGFTKREVSKEGRRVRRRKEARTRKDLTSKDFTGYAEITRNDSGWFTENKKTLNRKIKPRGWYKTIAKNLRKIQSIYKFKVEVKQ